MANSTSECVNKADIPNQDAKSLGPTSAASRPRRPGSQPDPPETMLAIPRGSNYRDGQPLHPGSVDFIDAIRHLIGSILFTGEFGRRQTWTQRGSAEGFRDPLDGERRMPEDPAAMNRCHFQGD